MVSHQESESRKNGNSLMLAFHVEYLGPLFGCASDQGQVLASLKSAEASRAALVAISLGV